MLYVEHAHPNRFYLQVNNNQEDTKVADPNRIVLPPAKWYQKEHIMRIVGVALIALGSVGVAASACLYVAGCLNIALPKGIAFVAAATVTLAVSIASIFKGHSLIHQEYWNDQAFVDRISESTSNQSFPEIIQNYGWERTSQHHFISKKKLTAKFLEHVQDKELSYKAVCDLFGDQIRIHKFIDWIALQPLLRQEVKAENLDAEEFKKQYGDQPLNDGVVSKNDPWFKKAVLNGIKGQIYTRIKQRFALEIKAGIISQESIVAELLNQYEQSASFEEFLNKQGGKKPFWSIFSDHILEPSYFKESFMKETKDMQICKVIETFGWEIFSTGMVDGRDRDFKTRFRKEEQKTPFSELLVKYAPNAWNIINYGLTEPHLVKPNIIKEIIKANMTFEGIIANYSWKIFSLKVISGKDPEIRNRFNQLAKKLNFRILLSTYENQMKSFQLLSQPMLETIHALKLRLKEENDLYTKGSEHALLSHENAVKQAEAQRNGEIQEAKAVIIAFKDRIRDENLRFEKATQLLESRINQCQKELRSLRNQSKAPLQAVGINDEERLASEILTSRQRMRELSQQHQVSFYNLTQQLKNVEGNLNLVEQQSFERCEKAKSASMNLMSNTCARLKLEYEAALEKIDAEYAEKIKVVG